MRASKLQLSSLTSLFPSSGYKSPWLSYPALYCVAILMQIFYAYLFGFVFADHILSSDAPTYIAAIKSIWGGKLDLMRTPTYPIILGTFKCIFGQGYIAAIIVAQIVVYFISSFFFQRIVSKFVYSSKVTFWITAYYLLGIGFNQYHYHIMTESFSISGMVMLLYFLLRHYSTQFRVSDAILSLLMLLILIYLRPVFVYLLPVIVIYFGTLYYLRKVNGRVLIGALLGCGLILSSMTYYTSVMYRTYGIRSIAIINTYNNYFMLRQKCLPDAKYTDNEQLKEVIDSINTSATIRPYEWIVWKEVVALASGWEKSQTYTPGDLEKFVYNSLQDQKVNCVRVLGSRLLAEDTVFPTLYEYNWISMIHLIIYPSVLQSALLFFGLIFYWIILWRREKQLLGVGLLLVMMIGGLWFASFIGAYNAYHRLCIPVMPAFLIMLGSVTNVVRLKLPTKLSEAFKS